VAALANEPAGTFVCRFSMSQPGCLVLSVKAAAGHPKADANNLIHAIIRVRLASACWRMHDWMAGGYHSVVATNSVVVVIAAQPLKT
jgi:hypothetical protein